MTAKDLFRFDGRLALVTAGSRGRGPQTACPLVTPCRENAR